MTPAAEPRACVTTGFRLIPVDGDRMFRVAIDRYGALSAVERIEGDERTDWGRFSVGSWTQATRLCPKSEEVSDLRFDSVFRRASRREPAWERHIEEFLNGELGSTTERFRLVSDGARDDEISGGKGKG